MPLGILNAGQSGDVVGVGERVGRVAARMRQVDVML